MNSEEKFRRGVYGLRVLAVIVMTVVTFVLTMAIVFSLISMNTFILVFLAWYALTVLFMWITGGLPIKDEEDDERRRNREGDRSPTVHGRATNGSAKGSSPHAGSTRASEETH